MDRQSMLEPICDEWRARLETGAGRLPLAERVRLLERLVVAHERYDEILASWIPETERRMKEIRAGRMEFIPAEVVHAELDAMAERGPDDPDPPIPEAFDDIEDQALYLPDGDLCLYLLLTNLEAGLPAEVDPSWRADIQRRVAAIPAEVERRYRECNADWADDHAG